MRRPTGERQQHGITGSMIADEVVAPPPSTRVTEMAPGVADGASLEVKGTGTVRRTQKPKTAPAARTPARPAAPRAPRAPRASTSGRPREMVALSAEAIERMRTELDQLTRVRRPDVVARIKAARELGDLKENSDYQAAREEQSFLEGRVRLLEDRLRFAVVIDDTPDESMAGRVVLGSVVTVELDGEPTTFTLVGTTDAKPAAGRISTSSPVGAALLGAAAGDEVEVRTPRGSVRYVVRSVS
jgi:transcription elongation factor GreA